MGPNIASLRITAFSNLENKKKQHNKNVQRLNMSKVQTYVPHMLSHIESCSECGAFYDGGRDRQSQTK
jgi:hypothetical protein